MNITIQDAIDALNKLKQQTLKATFYSMQAKKFAQEINRRTRAMGKSVEKDGDSEKQLAPLSASYIKQRKTNLSSKLLTPRIKSRSCLTLTGDMLDNIETKVTVSSNDIKMTLFFSGFNAKKAEWAEEGTAKRPKRPFFHFSDIQIQAFERDYTTFVTDQLQNYFDL